MIKMLFAAPASGTGKTMITCTMLSLLKKRGYDICTFKCGPDYIDPMFHKSVLKIESFNMDLFFMKEEQAMKNYRKYSAGKNAVVCEGVMGFYDGVGGTTTQASAWHMADTLNLPVILVVRPKGSSLTVAAVIKGLNEMRQPSHVVGVILNDCSEMLCKSIAKSVEQETGIPVLGCMPHMEEGIISSRHLGLYTAEEITDIDERFDKLVAQMEKSVDIDKLLSLCDVADDEINNAETTICHTVSCKKKPVISIARDEAFCFMYQENIDCMKEAGAEIQYFSPIHDACIPENSDALYFPGGYPELNAKAISENHSMIASVVEARKKKMPIIAECGGFMYMGQSLQDADDGNFYPMTGITDSVFENKKKLVRFGYTELQAEEDTFLLKKGESARVHEFHYWDSQNNGNALKAVKPITGRSWECVVSDDSLHAGFPHLYFPGFPEMAERFVAAAAKWRESC